MRNDKTGRWRALNLAAVSLLLAIVASWQLRAGFTGKSILLTVLFSIPVVLPLAGILKRNRYTYRWATLCVLPYFVFALTEAVANDKARTFATALLAASIFWFIVLIGFLRVSAPMANSPIASSSD